MNIGNITIPEHLNALLGQSTLGHAVRLSLQDFEQWIEGSTRGLFFFPEYTDHGPRHISAVLGAAETLIRPGAWKYLTSEDAAVLVLATLLHDCAMHLTADGFLDLIGAKDKPITPLVRSLDEKTWPELFDQFYLEARRWDQRKLHSLLGDQDKAVEEEEDLATYIRHPREKSDPEDWSLRYRKFLGEFVRRYHARLAHEIALSGVPGAGHNRLRLTHISDTLADLAGLVARSHNMHLRDTFPYLREKYYGRVHCSNSHPIFLMVLLRIADYLEIRADRVNPTHSRIQRLRSPVSQEEWNAHIAVHEVRPDEEDSEAVFVIARPPTAKTFLKIRRLLSGLQTELDTSWAVLGEVFSKQGDLSELGLALRRVRSNLDDLTQFIQIEKPAYIPMRAAFETAGVDLLKLLIKPLYGDRPEIGIRELLQNALDAVHELRQWAAERGDPERRSVPLPDQEADVLISIDQLGNKEYWLTVRDKGIGMTAETVRDYFLKAGASYRQSEIWRRHFESEGKSKILRSGRFGIGALAAFLLGNRIEVSTRHITAPTNEGLQFNASVEDEVIELKWAKLNHIGTTIRVKLTQHALKVLSNAKEQHDWSYVDSLRRRYPWDWYVLDDPKVERWFKGSRLSQQYHLPGPDPQALPADWRSVQVNGYQGVYWTYSQAPDLACNGIRIESYRHESQRKAQRKKLLGPNFSIIKRPALNIFDRDGILPLNLQRSEIETVEIPFAAELLKETLSDLYAFLLIHGPQDRASAQRWILSRPMNFEPLMYQSAEIERFWLTQDGIALTYPWHLKESCTQEAVLAIFKSHRYKSAESIEQPAIEVRSARNIFFGNISYHSSDKIPYLLKDFGLTEWTTSKLRSPKGKGEDEPFDFIYLRFDLSKIKTRKTPLNKFFEDIIEFPVIPFDPQERLKKLPKLFERLRFYIEIWQAQNLEGWRKKMVEQTKFPHHRQDTAVDLFDQLKRSLDSNRPPLPKN